MKKRILACFSIMVLISCLVFNTGNFNTYATTDNTLNDASDLDIENYSYGEYVTDFESVPNATEDILFTLQNETPLGMGKVITQKVIIPTDAKYELSLSYKCEDSINVFFDLKIDGKNPFDASSKISLPIFWTNSDKKQVDKYGNEFSPDQVLYEEVATTIARDYTGRYEYAYRFVLTKGEHEITLNGISGDIVVTQVKLCVPEVTDKYKEPQNATNLNTNPIVLEGEDADFKNNRSLIPLSNSTSALVNPHDAKRTKLNFIGGSNWSKTGDAVFWNFYVEKSGYYSIGFVYRQSYNLGAASYRILRIDDEIPFREAERLKFVYDNDWKYYDYSSGDNPYYIYLEEGRHTISLAATSGPLADIYHLMQNVTADMGDIYVDITKIVGETVDIYRSYELFNQIPDFEKRLTSVVEQLEVITDEIEKSQEKSSGSQVSNINNAIRVIRQMLDNPYTAHRYKSDFYDAYTNLSSLMGEITNMPLDIDRIILYGKGSDVEKPKVSFFERIKFSIQRLLYSFGDDYNQVDGEEKDSLTIWVNWGRDQAQVLNSLIQDDFVEKYGIKTDVSIVNATLIQAILAGDGPDVLLQLPRTSPLNYAMRGALYDLSRFEDLPEVLGRFNQGAEIPYIYNDGVYALPDTQSFNMMFVRTDILSKVGVKVPKTWDELIRVSNLLQRSNLQVYIPGQTIYPTLLLQKELSLYNESLSASTLTELPQIEVFEEMTHWYTKYKLPVTVDFYNRFRIGSAPIGIFDYSLYTQLKAAAPEIEGRWTVTCIPGEMTQDGKINYQSAGTGTGCSITRFTDNPQNAWEFLKWWTSAETQTTYSMNLESAIGYLGRIAVSNTEAFEGMDWDADMVGSILEQRKNTVEIPEVPGGYYTTRCLTQAFWYSVEQGASPTESMIKWGEILDNEIARKRTEYITE